MIFFKSRGKFIFVLNFLRCSPLVEVVVLDLEALVFLFDGCSHLSEVGVVDLEANLFLQCSPFGEVNLLDLEARVVSLIVGALI